MLKFVNILPEMITGKIQFILSFILRQKTFYFILWVMFLSCTCTVHCTGTGSGFQWSLKSDPVKNDRITDELHGQIRTCT